MRNVLIIACLLATTCAAEPQPKTMTKIEVILGSPGVVAGTFASKPKVFYRSGNRYCRIEEAPMPTRVCHNLMVVSEPDYWTVNLLTKTARHATDPGPTFNCHLPIVRGMAHPGQWTRKRRRSEKMEFGQEIEFFKARGAVCSERTYFAEAKKRWYTEQKSAPLALALFTYGTPERPLGGGNYCAEIRTIFTWYSG